MNFHHLTDEGLEKNLIELVAKERKLLSVIILHLMEIERRKVYAKSHGSLFDYLTKILKYSHGTTQRRVSATMLALEIPEILEAIQSGSLNLTQINTAQSAFKLSKRITKKKVPSEAKRTILNQIKGKTCEESEVLIYAALGIIPKKKTKLKRQSDGSVYFEGAISKTDWQTIQRAKELYSHSVPTGDLVELFVYFSERAIAYKEKTNVKPKKIAAGGRNVYGEMKNNKTEIPNGRKGHDSSKIPDDTSKRTTDESNLFPGKTSAAAQEAPVISNLKISNDILADKIQPGSSNANSHDGNAKQIPDGIFLKGMSQLPGDISRECNSEPGPEASSIGEKTNIPNGTAAKSVRHSRCFVQNSRIKSARKSIPAAVRRAVFAKAKCCQHVDQKTGAQCVSRWQLQIDHLQPIWAGGTNDIENLQVLCAVHNRARYFKQSAVRHARA